MKKLEKPKAIIVDIDGTVADLSHRLHYIKPEQINIFGLGYVYEHFLSLYENVLYFMGKDKDFFYSFNLETSFVDELTCFDYLKRDSFDFVFINSDVFKKITCSYEVNKQRISFVNNIDFFKKLKKNGTKFVLVGNINDKEVIEFKELFDFSFISGKGESEFEEGAEYIKRTLPKRIKDYKSFFAEMSKDKPIKDTIEIIKSLEKDFNILFVTGRPKEHLEITVQWILDNVLKHTLDKLFSLYMAPEGNKESDTEVKRKIYLEKIKPFYDVVAVFEDRTRVVEMYRELGLTVFQVNKWEELK